MTQLCAVMKELERQLMESIGRRTGHNHEAAVYLAWSDIVTSIACLEETKAALERMMQMPSPVEIEGNVVRGIDFSRARAPR